MPGKRKVTTRIPGERAPVPREVVLRAQRVHRGLASAYPDARCALDFQTPLDLYVATVLSAQCTDERVNKVTPALFGRCQTVEDYLALGPSGLEDIIRSTGFFRAKARNILAGCRRILEAHDGVVPRTMEELILVPGCGRKTANVILGNAYGTPGITVDTHMGRLARRLGLTAEKDPVKVEAALQPLIPEADWTLFSHRIISHGRTICDARKPLCGECPLRKDCPYPDAAPIDTNAVRSLRPKRSAGVSRIPAHSDGSAPRTGADRANEGSRARPSPERSETPAAKRSAKKSSTTSAVAKGSKTEQGAAKVVAPRSAPAKKSSTQSDGTTRSNTRSAPAKKSNTTRAGVRQKSASKKSAAKGRNRTSRTPEPTSPRRKDPTK